MREGGAQGPIAEEQMEDQSYGGEGEMSYDAEDDDAVQYQAHAPMMDMRPVPAGQEDQMGYGDEEEGEDEEDSMLQSHI
jgi:hypothetical protein